VDGQDEEPGAVAAGSFSVGDRVRICPGTSDDRWGTIVEDFGDDAGYSVVIGDHHIADASRRWAVSVDDGNLVFLDTAEMAQPNDVD
ncbi:MAG TPA: hypothetical protein VGC05_11000, partial [Mycobacterium sp.]